jgi:hypothetical protein
MMSTYPFTVYLLCPFDVFQKGTIQINHITIIIIIITFQTNSVIMGHVSKGHLLHGPFILGTLFAVRGA